MNTTKQDTRIHFLYKIVNKINEKIYIGQSVDTYRRWQAHCKDAEKNDPPSVISKAIKKYGKINFEFKVIASCKTYEDANDTETLLVKQYNSLVPLGYNVSNGGYNAPKTEAWKTAMRNWHASLSAEEKEKRSKMHSETTLKLIAEKGHPALGTKRTPEQIKKLIEARKNNPVEYTTEVRQHMSEAHLGLKDSEETKKKKSESIKEQWKTRGEYDDKKCEALNCDISGKAKYKIIDGIRYCNKHGLRALRTGTAELLPRSSYNKGKKTPEETLIKLRGRVPHNKITFSAEQIEMIMSDSRSSKKVAKDLGVTEKVVIRIRKERQASVK